MPEIQDLYDTNRNPTGEHFVRGGIIPEGRCRLGVQVWLRNNNGDILLTQRHPAKKKPLLWEPTGGAVISGEDTLAAGLRELNEEIGIQLQADDLHLIATQLCNGIEFLDTYAATWNGEISELQFQDTEVVDARWVTPDELISMEAGGLLACDTATLFPHRKSTDRR